MPESRKTRGAGGGRIRPTVRAVLTFPVQTPLMLIVVLILGMILMHVVVQKRQARIDRAISLVVVPARAAAQAVQVAIAQQNAALRGYILTGDRVFLARYAEASGRERDHLERLEAAAERLGGEWPARVERLARASAAWHADIARSGLLTRPEPPMAGHPLVIDPFAHDTMNEMIGDLYLGLVGLEQAQWRRLWNDSRLEFAATVILLVGVVGLDLVIGWVTHRAQRLAASLDRLAREEREFRELARELAAAPSPAALGETLADGARALAGSRTAYVERILPGRRQVTGTAALESGPTTVCEAMPYPGSLTEYMARRGVSEILASVDALRGSVAPRLARLCPGCSAVSLPLTADGQVLGAFVLLRGPDQRPFVPREVGRIHIVADFASLALFRVLHLEEARQETEREAEHAEKAERQRREIERLMQGKSRFIRGVSHDLKNPLGAVLGYAELLESGVGGELGTKQRESVQRIRHATEAALKLINDLVDLSRVEANQLRLDRVAADPAPVIRDVVDQYRAQAESAGQRLEARTGPTLERVYADTSRMRQILDNLLSNAVKYTPRGGRIAVEAGISEATVRGRRGRWYSVAVSDTGPGIAPKDQERIFEEYARLERTDRPGTGLGLAISRSIARLMEGDITVRSKLGRGSTFTLWLPLADGDTTTGQRAR